MKIYTKKGDQGKTGLIGGTRVSKSHIRIDAYGTIDELNAFTGLLRDHLTDQRYTEQLLEIQDRLFTMGSHLANDESKSKMELPPMHSSDIEQLEIWMDEMDEKLPPMKSFVLPGGHPTVSYAHVCRTVCRRAERKITQLQEMITMQPIFLQYVNRLSDYFFVLGRKIAMDLAVEESPWKPKH